MTRRECRTFFFFFSSRRRHTRFKCDWSSDVCSSDLRLRQRGLGLAERALGALLRDRHVRPELDEILLGGEAGGVLDRRAAAEQQGGEEKGAPSPRHGIRGYRGLTRKWARRFLAQHASLCSVHCGRSSP